MPKTKTELENQFETGDSIKTKSTVSKEQTDFDPVQLIKAHEKSLYVHCGDFIDSLNLTLPERLVAYKFLEELAPTGWVDVTVNEVADQTSLNKEMIESVLKKLQTIEPAGLFARTLVECLKLQAEDANLLDDNLESILDNLHLLGSGKFDLLKRRCGFNDEELSENLRIIKSFNPKPGLLFSSDAINIREPDLKITQKDGHAPPTTISRKSYQSVNPISVLAW